MNSKKVLIILFMCMLTMQMAHAKVLIDEVYYNPVNDENGGEFVLLYNDGLEQVDLSEYIITTSLYEEDAVLPPNTSIQAGGYLLIADSGFSLDKDNPLWPDADYEEAMSMPNTDGFIYLANSSHIIDSVGWGDAGILSNISEFGFEGSPAQIVDEGFSLKRNEHTDTDNNSADFFEAVPLQDFLTTDDNSTLLSQDVMNVSINVLDSIAKIVSFEILMDDLQQDGVQIMPASGISKDVPVRVVAFDADGAKEIEGALVTFDGQQTTLLKNWSNETHAEFIGSFEIPYYTLPENHSISAELSANNTNSSTIQQVFEVLANPSLEIDSDISLEVNPNSNESALTSFQVKNTGNVKLSLGFRTDGFSKGDVSMSPSQLSIISKENQMTLSESFALAQAVLEPGVDATEEFEISFNQALELDSGRYNGDVYVGGFSIK